MSQKKATIFLWFIEQLFTFRSDIYLQGDTIESFIQSQPIAGTTVNVFVENEVKSFVDLVHCQLSKYLTLTDEQRIYTSNTKCSQSPNTWRSLFCMNGCTFTIVWSSFTKHNNYFDCELLLLAQNGLVLPSQIQPKPSIVLQGLRNMCNKNTHMLLDNDLKISDSSEMFGLILRQERIIKKGKEVLLGVKTATHPDAFCAVCYLYSTQVCLYTLKCGHIFCVQCLDYHKCSFSLANNENCPLCRKPIVFDRDLSQQ